MLAERQLGDVEGHAFHGNQWTDGGISKDTVYAIGYVTPQGEIRAVGNKKGEAEATNHSMAFPNLALSHPDLRFRMRVRKDKALVEWDDEPTADNYHAVADYFENRGIKIDDQQVIPFV